MFRAMPKEGPGVSLPGARAGEKEAGEAKYKGLWPWLASD